MAYEDSRFRSGAGFRDEPEDRGVPPVDNTSSYAGGDFSSVSNYPADTEPTDTTPRRTRSAAQLGDVFDDPRHGDPGRDRMGVHLLWELVLLLGVAAIGFVLYRSQRAAVSGDALRELMVDIAVLGLLALAMGLSLRAATPNLAVGPVAYGSAMYFTLHADSGLVRAALLTGALAAGVGLAIAVLVAGFHVPAWAASFASGLAMMVWIQMRDKSIQLPSGMYQPTRHALYWLAGFAALALIGSLPGLSKGVRRTVGRFRPISDPARRRGVTGGIIAALALVASSVLAAAGGVLFALRMRTIAPPDRALEFTALALGVALLAGTSAYGRRGGIFGTILAAVLVSLVIRYADVAGRNVAPLAIAATAIGVGLVITRLVETFGRPLTPVRADDDWTDASTPPTAGPAVDTSWSPSRSGWTTQSGAEVRWPAEDRWGSQ